MKRRVKTGLYRITGLLLGILLLGVCTGCGKKAPELLEPIGSGENLVTVLRGEMYNTIVSQTTVIPKVEYVTMNGQGIVSGLPVTLGDHVNEGDVLVELDGKGVSEQAESVDEQIARLSSDNAYLNQLTQVQIDVLKAELAQLQANGGTAEEIQEKQEELADQQDRLYNDQIKQDKELAQLQMQKMEGVVSGAPLVSPCDGTVIAMRAGNIGDTLESGVAAAVAVDGSKELKGEFLEEEVLNEAHEYYALINGKRYEITPSPYSQSELSWIHLFEGTPYGTYYLNEGEDADYGEMAMVVVITDYKEDVLYIPDNALYSDVDSYYVYVQNENGERERRDIEIGFEWNNAVEITKGLEEGEVLYAK